MALFNLNGSPNSRRWTVSGADDPFWSGVFMGVGSRHQPTPALAPPVLTLQSELAEPEFSRSLSTIVHPEVPQESLDMDTECPPAPRPPSIAYFDPPEDELPDLTFSSSYSSLGLLSSSTCAGFPGSDAHIPSMYAEDPSESGAPLGLGICEFPDKEGVGYGLVGLSSNPTNDVTGISETFLRELEYAYLHESDETLPSSSTIRDLSQCKDDDRIVEFIGSNPNNTIATTADATTNPSPPRPRVPVSARIPIPLMQRRNSSPIKNFGNVYEHERGFTLTSTSLPTSDSAATVRAGDPVHESGWDTVGVDKEGGVRVTFKGKKRLTLSSLHIDPRRSPSSVSSVENTPRKSLAKSLLPRPTSAVGVVRTDGFGRSLSLSRGGSGPRRDGSIIRISSLSSHPGRLSGNAGAVDKRGRSISVLGIRGIDGAGSRRSVVNGVVDSDLKLPEKEMKGANGTRRPVSVLGVVRTRSSRLSHGFGSGLKEKDDSGAPSQSGRSTSDGRTRTLSSSARLSENVVNVPSSSLEVQRSRSFSRSTTHTVHSGFRSGSGSLNHSSSTRRSSGTSSTTRPTSTSSRARTLSSSSRLSVSDHADDVEDKLQLGSKNRETKVKNPNQKVRLMRDLSAATFASSMKGSRR